MSAEAHQPSKKVAILQSSYIPWKGYFDLINSVDEFILYDDVQYTKRDWRSRNQIKTQHGLQWLSIPIEVRGNRFQAIRETKVSSSNWGEKHWNALTCAYGKAPFFKTYRAAFEPLFRSPASSHLSWINHSFITAILGLLGITTKISFSMDYPFERTEKNQQLINLCIATGATHYLSGPAAASYLNRDAFSEEGIALSLYDYSNYPEYRQAHPPFEHAVTILDLLFNEGPASTQFMKSFAATKTTSIKRDVHA